MSEDENVSPPETTAEEPPVDSKAQLEKELKEMQEKYLRALAEGENARKRLQKEKQEMMRFGIENTLSDFFPPIDNFENALSFAQKASPEVQNWAQGFQMILRQFKEVLANHDIKPFTSEGTFFDPQKHEAVEMVETEEVPEGLILEESVKGYENRACPIPRTLRPARVKVAKKPTHQETPKEPESSQEETEIKNRPSLQERQGEK